MKSALISKDRKIKDKNMITRLTLLTALLQQKVKKTAECVRKRASKAPRGLQYWRTTFNSYQLSMGSADENRSTAGL